MKKLVLLATSAAVLATLSFAKEIKIGVTIPMSGPYAGYGQPSYEGIELAHSLQPTLKNGDTIKLVLTDTKSDKVEAANAATRLISSDKVVGILGEIVSTNTAQVMAIAEKKQIPVITPSSTNDKLVEQKQFANRVCFTDSFQGTVVGNYTAKELKYKTAVVVLDQAQVYSLGLTKAFKEAFEKAGGTIVKEIKVNSGDKDYKAVISQIKTSNPDFLFLPMYHPEVSMIARQAKQAGFTKPMFSGDGVANQTFIELGGDAVEGYMFTDLFDYAAPPTQRSKDFIAAYAKKTGKQDVNSFVALGADAYNIMVDAMNRCANPEDNVCINKMIKSTKNFEGVSGILNMDESGNTTRSAVIKVIQNGKAVYRATVNP